MEEGIYEPVSLELTLFFLDGDVLVGGLDVCLGDFSVFAVEDEGYCGLDCPWVSHRPVVDWFLV